MRHIINLENWSPASVDTLPTYNVSCETFPEPSAQPCNRACQTFIQCWEPALAQCAKGTLLEALMVRLNLYQMKVCQASGWHCQSLFRKTLFQGSAILMVYLCRVVFSCDLAVAIRFLNCDNSHNCWWILLKLELHTLLYVILMPNA